MADSQVIKQIEDSSGIKHNISGAAIVLEDNSTTTAGTWLAKTNQISALADGQIFLYKITKAGAATTTLNIAGSSGTAFGAKTIYRNGTVKLTTEYAVGEYILLVYIAASTCFKVLNDYDKDTQYSAVLYTTQSLLPEQQAQARANIGTDMYLQKSKITLNGTELTIDLD